MQYNNSNNRNGYGYRNGNGAPPKQPTVKKPYRHWSLQVSYMPNGEQVTESLLRNWRQLFVQHDTIEYMQGAFNYNSPDGQHAIFQFRTKYSFPKDYIHNFVTPGYWANPYSAVTGRLDDDEALFTTACQQVRAAFPSATSIVEDRTDTDSVATSHTTTSRARESKISVGCDTKIKSAMGSVSTAWSCTKGSLVKRQPRPKRGRDDESGSDSDSPAGHEVESVEDNGRPSEANESVAQEHAGGDEAGSAFLEKRRALEIAKKLRGDRI